MAQTIDANAAPHWVETVISTVETREAEAATKQYEREAAQQHLDGLVRSDGAIYIMRLFAEVEAVAAAWNARIGERVLAASHRIEVGLRSRDGSFVSFTPLLSTERGAPMPGVTVRMRGHGREGTRPFDFTASETGLTIDGDGPEAFARRMIEPWLESLPKGGR